MRGASWAPRAVIGACVVLAAAGLGAAPRPLPEAASSLCLLGLLGDCASSPSPTAPSSPAPVPVPTPSLSGLLPTGIPLPTGLPSGMPTPTPTVPGRTQTIAPSRSPAPGPEIGTAENRPRAVFSSHPAQLRGSALTISGLSGIGVVSVPTAAGTISAIEIDCASLAIDGLWLKVEVSGGHGLLTTASRLTLNGHVQVYLHGLSATGPTGPISLDPTDLPKDLASLSPLSDVTFSYVGSTADDSVWSGTQESLF